MLREICQSSRIIISHDDVEVNFHGTSLEHEGQRATRLLDTMFNDPENVRGESTGKAIGCGKDMLSLFRHHFMRIVMRELPIVQQC